MRIKKILFRGTISLFLVLTMVLAPFTKVHATYEINSNNQSTSYTVDQCEVVFRVTSKWSNAFNAEVSIKNISNKVIDNWALGFDMPYDITNIWNGTIYSHNNEKYVIKNVGSNQDISVGNSVNFGFTASYIGELQFPQNYELLCYENDVPSEQYSIKFKATNDWQNAYNG